MMWIFGRGWDRIGPKLFQVVIGNTIKRGHGITTELQQGAALWQPPGLAQPSFLTQAWDLFRTLLVFRGSFARAMQIEEFIQTHHPQNPHWYLSFIGTDSRHRGKNIGTKLITPVLEACDKSGLPAYLESSNEKNLSFYNRHGFEVVTETKMPGGPTFWPMLRQPRLSNG